jgi:hypothetical protein
MLGGGSLGGGLQTGTINHDKMLGMKRIYKKADRGHVHTPCGMRHVTVSSLSMRQP